MAWSPDKRTFYFGDSLRNVIFAYDYDDNAGTLRNRRVLLERYPHGVPDGSCIDADGCLWNTRFGGARVIRIAPNGSVDAEDRIADYQPDMLHVWRVGPACAVRHNRAFRSARERSGLQSPPRCPAPSGTAVRWTTRERIRRLMQWRSRSRNSLTIARQWGSGRGIPMHGLHMPDPVVSFRNLQLMFSRGSARRRVEPERRSIERRAGPVGGVAQPNRPAGNRVWLSRREELRNAPASCNGIQGNFRLAAPDSGSGELPRSCAVEPGLVEHHPALAETARMNHVLTDREGSA